MRIKGLKKFFLAATLLLIAATGALAQSSSGGSGGSAKLIVPVKSGYFVSFSTAPEAKAADAGNWSTSFAEVYPETNTIRRVFVDTQGSLYFGYALIVESVPASKQFRISVRPLGPEDEQELRSRKSLQSRRLRANFNAAGLSRSSSPQIITDGDTFALDVLVNPQTGDKITDIVTVASSMDRLEDAPVTESPRDFTLEDVEMRMVNYRLLINGELVAGGKQSGACAGPLVWFHLPERGGRFIFSVMPHPGYNFQKIGTIENNKIKFTLNGERYEWISNTPVIGAGGNWNLYVLYDKSYVPDPFLLGVDGAAQNEPRATSGLERAAASYPSQKRTTASGFEKSADSRKDGVTARSSARLVIGASDRVENLLPKQ